MELSPASSVFMYLLVAFLLYVAKQWGLFSSIPYRPVEKRALHPATPLVAFGIYFIGSLFFPYLVYGILRNGGFFSHPQPFVLMSGIVQVAVIAAIAVCLILFICMHTKKIRSMIWGERERIIPLFLKGVLLSVAIYPLMALFMQAVHIAVEFIHPFTRVDQVAVEQVRRLKEYPTLYWILTFEVALLVPVIEELLFRGCTQTFFSSFVGIKPAIWISSLLFALMHYAPGQGLTNIELLSTLFLLSFLIGCAYSRERSLWMSIGMHCGFNTVSLLLM